MTAAAKRAAPATDPVQIERQRIRALRMQMLEMHPFWGYLLLQVKLVPAPGLPAFAATDCLRHVWYNPDRTRTLVPEELGFVLAHEVGHQVLQSGNRQAGRDPLRWNMATDFCINRIVSAIDKPGRWGKGDPLYRPPKGILLNPRFDGMIAETIYERLCGEQRAAARRVRVVLTTGQEGDSGPSIEFPDLADHGGGIDLHLPVGLSPEQRELLRDRIAAAIEHWEGRRQRGDTPGALLRELGFLDRPRVPWRRVLHRLADQALARDDYSLARPNKRYLEHDAVVPGLYGERVGKVVVALDTSGSMSAGTLAMVGRELRGIADSVEEMILIVADADVQQVVGFDEFEDFLRQGRIKGGGGTDHRPVFQHIRDRPPAPAIFVGLTDLYSRFPDQPPAYPVLWLVPPSHGHAPWGQVIEIHDPVVSNS